MSTPVDTTQLATTVGRGRQARVLLGELDAIAMDRVVAREFSRVNAEWLDEITAAEYLVWRDLLVSLAAPSETAVDSG